MEHLRLGKGRDVMRTTLGRSAPLWLFLALAMATTSCVEDIPTNAPLDVIPNLHLGDDGMEHSHGRFASLTWAPVEGLVNTVDFTFKIGLRRSNPYPCQRHTGFGWASTSCTGGGGRLGVGDIFNDNLGGSPPLNFGDGTSNPVRFRVTTVNLAEDWVFGEAVDHFTGQDKMRHTYGGSGPYISSTRSAPLYVLEFPDPVRWICRSPPKPVTKPSLAAESEAY